MKILPSDNSYATFCDLVIGYRLLSTLMEAVSSGIIDTVGLQPCRIDDLLDKTAMNATEGRRFIALLLHIGILERFGELLSLSRFSAKYLHTESSENQLNSLQFEKLLQGKWDGLGGVLHDGQATTVIDLPEEKRKDRLGLFQMAMGEAARIRAQELWGAFPNLAKAGVIFDAGAGDGSYLMEFLKGHQAWCAVACDLPDVVALHSTVFDSAGIAPYPCNLADPLERESLLASHSGTISVLLLSNFIHCYGLEEIAPLLVQLSALLTEEGILVIHDFFLDANPFGALYDIHMMVSTYNGRTYSFSETAQLLNSAGLEIASVLELPSYSHAVLATKAIRAGMEIDPIFSLRSKAGSLGFFAAITVDPATIRSEPWVKAKCAYGCSFYGRKWSCPPNSLDSDAFEKLLSCYTKALVVAGQPPLRAFQEQLLELEKTAFLGGYKKALVFSAGPCSWCPSCSDERCRFPEKRRPSLESCGCDVFTLAKLSGIPIAPITSRDDFVQYIALLLVE